MSRICRNVGDSGKLRFFKLDHESKMRLLQTHSHTSNRLAMEPGTREVKQLKETQTLQQGKSHPSKTCHVPPVWRRGGRKGSRTCRVSPVWGGGQERLYGKPTTDKVLWRGEPSSIWRGTQALAQGRTHAKPPRGPSARRRVRRGNDKYSGWKVATPYSPGRGGSV